MKLKKLNKVWVVIPAHNEEKHIEKVIKKAKKFAKNILVVDDGSQDKTSAVAEKSGAFVLKHIVNLGKGAALKTGCEYAIKNKAEKIVVLDADGQHDPKEIPEFVKALDNADIVFGYRRLNKNMPFVLRYGNWFIFFMAKLLFGLKIADTQCGYRSFTADAYNKIKWNAVDYSMESEMIANVGKANLRYSQIPIETIYSDKYKGTTVIDGIRIVLNMVWWKITR
ncbi:glycosyltransferase family 2 protein [Candidatus Woesearchaeota archaeon]|nr:glycosyltransferase family 2 protein [Candidatus Woesearchaeota archaeon]